MGPKVKTFYDVSLEKSGSDYKKKANVKREEYFVNNWRPSECTTELFNICGYSVRRYHLDLLSIGLQFVVLIALIRNRK